MLGLDSARTQGFVNIEKPSNNWAAPQPLTASDPYSVESLSRVSP